MTDKQIIDGVDVCGCNFLGVKLTKKYMCMCDGIDFCSDEPNCHYKNWQRKEQECDKLKQTLAEIKELMEIEIECKTYEIENDCFNETRCKALKEHIDFTKQILREISEVSNER